jgi:hypothetical protein
MVMLELFKFLHFVGLAFGLGGATIAAIIAGKAEKDVELGKQAGKILPPIVKLIWTGLIFLAISGIMLPYYIKWSIDNNLLIGKHILVAWIIIFGVILGFNSKKMMKLAQENTIKKDKIEREKIKFELLKAKRTMKICSIINLILWYLVTFLSAFV